MSVIGESPRTCPRCGKPTQLIEDGSRCGDCHMSWVAVPEVRFIHLSLMRRGRREVYCDPAKKTDYTDNAKLVTCPLCLVYFTDKMVEGVEDQQINRQRLAKVCGNCMHWCGVTHEKGYCYENRCFTARTTTCAKQDF